MSPIRAVLWPAKLRLVICVRNISYARNESQGRRGLALPHGKLQVAGSAEAFAAPSIADAGRQRLLRAENHLHQADARGAAKQCVRQLLAADVDDHEFLRVERLAENRRVKLVRSSQ